MQLGLFENPQVTGPSESKSVSRATKREAFRDSSSRRGSQESAVLAAIQSSRDSGLTRNEIADRLGLPLASVCGRVNELLESGDVFQQPGVKQNKRAVVFAKGYC